MTTGEEISPAPLDAMLTGRARRLRTQATDAERALWRLLRSRQIGGLKFRRQQPYGPFVLDFYCHEHRLAIEADGGQHLDAENIAQDRERTRYLEAHGLRVLRFTNVEILRQPDEVVAAIVRAVPG